MIADPESRQLQSLWQERDREVLRLRSEQTEKWHTHHDSVTGMISKVVTEAGGPLPLHHDTDLSYRNQAETSDTLMRGRLPDEPQGVIQTLTVAAGTGPQTLTSSALAATDQIDHLAAGMTVALMTVSKPLMTKEAHAARTGSHRQTQCMISMTCQEAAGCAVAAAVADAPCHVSHACHMLSSTQRQPSSLPQ